MINNKTKVSGINNIHTISARRIDSSGIRLAGAGKIFVKVLNQGKTSTIIAIVREIVIIICVDKKSQSDFEGLGFF